MTKRSLVSAALDIAFLLIVYGVGLAASVALIFKLAQWAW